MSSATEQDARVLKTLERFTTPAERAALAAELKALRAAPMLPLRAKAAGARVSAKVG
jgi:hypothetical protein